LNSFHQLAAKTTNTLTALDAQQTFLELLKQVTEHQSTFKIQHAGGAVVLLSEADYEGLLETLELLSIPGFRECLQRSMQQVSTGETYSLAEVFGDDE
jgi:antitoxin YefM